ncbi:hypothetical protein PENSPDRAFT_514353 [Peniophora sp. CONT]|nr:hypothetical protein PENSPDRAFT_514353 [Peniophora sp. CONT]
MKFFAVLTSLVAVATAQSVTFTTPRSGGTLSRGSPTTITIQRPTTSTTVQSVSIVLSLDACTGSTCPNPSSALGTILFAGPFNPTGSPPSQSFNVTIPATFPSGEAEILATHFSLTGTGPTASTEIDGEIIFVR